jgi:hypothetical protein
MGKKNSPEAKALRKAKVAAKRKAFANPAERPNDCLRHYGFIPNEDFFKHAAIAVNEADIKLAMRSKENLIQCREDGLLQETFGRTSGFVYLSFYRTGDYKNIATHKGQAFDTKSISDETDKFYYIYRPMNWMGQAIGEAPVPHQERAKHLPFLHESNTIMVPLDKLEELPDVGITHDEIAKWAEVDEGVMPMNEEELDHLLAVANECALRENYEFNEDGLIIQEYEGKGSSEGETFYQPKKKKNTLVRCFIPHPFTLMRDGLCMADYAASHQQYNTLTGSNI